jgi:adenine deaminase
MENTVKILPVKKEDFIIIGAEFAIEVAPGEVLTRSVLVEDGVPFNKIACIERHKASGAIGCAFITGLGLERGAVAQTISHDSHNIIVVGASDEDMAIAVAEIERIQGGIVVVLDGRVIASLRLEIAGLMTNELTAEQLVEKLNEINKAIVSLGVCPKINLGIELSFLALPVIPSIRITPRGIIEL